MPTREAEVRTAFALQAGFCDRLGSPFTARLCRLLGERLDRSSAVGRRILDWPGQPDHLYDVVPLRLAGGLRALVRRGVVPDLAAFYPPAAPGEPDAFWPVLADVLQRQAAELEPWLDSPPQTNEVARSAPLMAGLRVIAVRFGLPVALYELGASAGLNLLLDHYHYRLGGEVFGPASSVHLEPVWQGPPPPRAEPRVLRRRGVDLAPLDVTRAADRERLIAYVWPDQSERIARLEAALAIAQANPPKLDRDDAAAWAEAQIAVEPEPGLVRVATHTIAMQYFPDATRLRLIRHFERVGAAATAAAPFTWLRFESVDRGMPELRLTVWPGADDRLLATADPHARRIVWQHVDAG